MKIIQPDSPHRFSDGTPLAVQPCSDARILKDSPTQQLPEQSGILQRLQVLFGDLFGSC